MSYPAEKKSMREKLMRKGIKADERFPFEQLFFEGDFSRPLAESNTFSQALSMARLAPSAANKQPWRAVVIHNLFKHFLLVSHRINLLLSFSYHAAVMIRVADKSCGNDYVYIYILTHPYSIGKIPHRFIMVRGRKKNLLFCRCAV